MHKNSTATSSESSADCEHCRAYNGHLELGVDGQTEGGGEEG